MGESQAVFGSLDALPERWVVDHGRCALIAARHPELTVDPASARRHVTAGWFLVAPMAVALLISFFVESGALWALLLLVPSQAIGSRISRRQSGQTQPV